MVLPLGYNRLWSCCECRRLRYSLICGWGYTVPFSQAKESTLDDETITYNRRTYYRLRNNPPLLLDWQTRIFLVMAQFSIRNNEPDNAIDDMCTLSTYCRWANLERELCPLLQLDWSCSITYFAYTFISKSVLELRNCQSISTYTIHSH